MKRKFYGKGLPGVKLSELKGTLIVVEGGDGAGRSTQIKLLKDYLERLGYPTVEAGLKRSDLVGKELGELMRGHALCPITLSLFYITDFADQLENQIIPALRAGFVVLADRYIYSLIARHTVRGVAPEWLTSVCGIGLEPDSCIYLRVNPQVLADRSFRKKGTLDYWESGMDIERHGDMYECFIAYQRKMAREFATLTRRYRFTVIDGEQDPLAMHREIVGGVKKLLKRPIGT